MPPVASAALVAAFLFLASSNAQAAELVPVGDFSAPLYATAPPGDERRLFVVERDGRIRVVKDGNRVAGRFLKIPGGVSAAGEGGLLSMAFHPRYSENGLFYVYYTDGPGDIRIDEFKRRQDDADEAKAGSQRHVLRIRDRESTGHYGGQLQFGPDELLYASIGDGGGGGDPLDNAQDKRSLFGKMLRIDPTEDDGDQYSVPGGNPYVGRHGRNEIYSVGLRNPFRFSFDRSTGDLTIGDVGQGEWEEIDFAERGEGKNANYGWNCFEASRPYNGGCDVKGHDAPVFEYPHTDGGFGCVSVTGGYVVRSPSLASELGRYLYGDYCSGEIRTLSLPSGGDDRRVPGVDPQARLAINLVSFGEDANGCPYVMSHAGPVSRIADDGDPAGGSCAAP